MAYIKKLISPVIFILIVLTFNSYGYEITYKPTIKYNLQFDFNKELVYQLPFITPSSIEISELTEAQNISFESFKSQLTVVPPTISTVFDLLEYQTPVKDQNPRGSCVTFAFIGAVEAAYVRKYGLNKVNMNTTTGNSNWSKYYITNDCTIPCITEDCLNNCEEFDLSEEFYIHAVFSSQSTYNSSLLHDSLPSSCYLSEDIKPGPSGVLIATDGADGRVRIPKEKYALYYGNVNSANGTSHSMDDYMQLLEDNNIIYYDSVDKVYKCSTSKTQLEVDGFEYSTDRIPLDARKNAIYGVTKMQLLSEAETKDTGNLETILYNNYEVSIGVDLAGLDCAMSKGNTYTDGSAENLNTDGNVICKENVRLCDSGPYGSTGCEGVWEGYDEDGEYWNAAHQMLLVGFDHSKGLFLLKNSWGTARPYIWVTYNYIHTQSLGGEIVIDVVDPLTGPDEEALWHGRWKMDFDGHIGDLVIRRTRTVPEPYTIARIGSYYETGSLPRPVNGYIEESTGNLIFYINFNDKTPDDGPWDLSTPITLEGQYFRAEIFNARDNTYSHGNFASGYTIYGERKYGLLLNRDNVSLDRPSSGSFSKDDWHNDFKLYYSDGNEAEFDISSIASSTTSNLSYPDPFYAVFARYYPLEGAARDLGANQGLVADHTNQMFFEEELSHPDIFYHTWEKNIISGLGVFGVKEETSDDNSGGTSCFIETFFEY